MPLTCSGRFISLWAAGPPGPQEVVQLSMGDRFSLLDLEAKAHFSQDDPKTSAKEKKNKEKR